MSTPRPDDITATGGIAIPLSEGVADIYACGLRLRTGMPLPMALPWPGPADAKPDVTFVKGPVGPALVDPVVDREVIQIGAHGTVLVRLAGIGYFLVRGRQIVCDLDLPGDAPALAAIVFGNLIACSCWRRRQLALHASAVAIGDKALVLPGRLGAGKSLLAAALVRRGHVLLADEMVAITGGMCRPTGGALQLADDALAALTIDPGPLAVYDHFRVPKRPWIAGAAAEPRPYPVAGVVCLTLGEAGTPAEPERLNGDRGPLAVLDHFYWRDMLDVLDSRIWAQRAAEELAVKAPIFALGVPHGLDRVGEVADRLEGIVLEDVRAGG